MTPKKTAVKKTTAKKAIITTVGSGNRAADSKLPVTKMTKTALIRYMAEQMAGPTEAGCGLLHSADRDRHNPDPQERRVHGPGPGQAGEGATCCPDRPQPADRRGDQDQGQDGGEVPAG